MINTISSLIGYSGTDPVVTYLIVSGAIALTLCIAYKFLDFLLTVVTSLLGRNNKIKF